MDIEMIVRHGVVTDGTISPRRATQTDESQRKLGKTVLDQKLHELQSWKSVLSPLQDRLGTQERTYLLDWLQRMIPNIADYEEKA